MQFAKEFLLPCRASPIHVYTVSFPSFGKKAKVSPGTCCGWAGGQIDVVETLNCVVVAVMEVVVKVQLSTGSLVSLILQPYYSAHFTGEYLEAPKSKGTSQELYSWSTVETKIQTEVSDLSQLYGLCLL